MRLLATGMARGAAVKLAEVSNTPLGTGSICNMPNRLWKNMQSNMHSLCIHFYLTDNCCP